MSRETLPDDLPDCLTRDQWGRAFDAVAQMPPMADESVDRVAAIDECRAMA